jgi:UDPglucose 6-dehydrogenase
MMQSTIGFVGMTHLGLISAVAASEKGFQIFCFDPNNKLIETLKNFEPPITEPQLIDLLRKNNQRLFFSSDPKALASCDVIFVAPDVSTDDKGHSDLSVLNELLQIVFECTSKKNIVVILSQVPPGFTRGQLKNERSIYYQVETLIFGQAINRALFPERYIIGCSHPQDILPVPYLRFLKAHDCPILQMRFESAELAKISINMCLAASVTTANILAELCEEIGADWAEIVPALKLDRRIGQYSYLNPGLGISGGNLERDLTTVISCATRHGTDVAVVNAWIENSKRRKNWIWNIYKKLEAESQRSKRIGILGLTYKENTHSSKNSPALVFLSQLADRNVIAYDPVAPADAAPTYVTRAQSVLEAIRDAEVLVIATAWPEFGLITIAMLVEHMAGRVVIDPYGLLGDLDLTSTGFSYFKLGVSF